MLEAFHSSSRSALWASLASKLIGFARESLLIQRESKHFDPEDFLLGLLEANSTGRASFSQLAASIGHKAKQLLTSPQALHQRINRTECGVEGFLVRCLGFICRHRFPIPGDGDGGCGFTRVLVEDSTTWRLPKANAEAFPAHGNACGETAGAKVDLAFDLLSGEVIHCELHVATEQDKTIGVSLLDSVRCGDLVLRDMGYFGVENFAVIEERGAFWLSRMPLSADAHTADGRSIETVLESCRGNTVDRAVTLTAREHPARLVAVRASVKETERRRRVRRKEAKAKGRTASKKALLRDGWHLMVTNAPAAKAGVTTLAGYYSQRWLIEMAFRAWKQAGNLAKALNRTSSPQHLKALMLAGMIAMSISLKIGLMLARSRPDMRYSLEKIFDFVFARMASLTRLAEIGCLKPDPRHIQGQKRARMSLSCRLMELLG